MIVATSESADRATLSAAATLALVIPGDTLLYLLLPLYAPVFGVSLPEAGILLAANRLVRIVLYPKVARFYAASGARTAALAAALAGIAATVVYATCSGLWLLLIGRLVWGFSFATLNLVTQAVPTAVAQGAARRSGRARTIIASGSMIGLVAGALLAEWIGPRAVLAIAAGLAMLAPLFALKLPTTPEPIASGSPSALSRPGPMSIWAFCFGFTIDGIFIFGLALLAKASFAEGAVIAAGLVMALRYGAQMLLSGVSGRLAERVGAFRLLIVLSLVLAVVLALLTLSGAALWTAVIAVVVLWALIQPLPPPVLAELYPGPDRVPALARQNIWRDIGAGTGPLAAGTLFATMPAVAIWLGAATLLGAAGALLKLRGRAG